MSVKSKCEGCKHAAWNKTVNGRLHPDKSGRCTWTATFRIAASSMAGTSWTKRGEPIVVKGGHIWRGSEGPSACDVFQPAEQIKRLAPAQEQPQ